MSIKYALLYFPDSNKLLTGRYESEDEWAVFVSKTTLKDFIIQIKEQDDIPAACIGNSRSLSSIAFDYIFGHLKPREADDTDTDGGCEGIPIVFSEEPAEEGYQPRAVRVTAYPRRRSIPNTTSNPYGYVYNTQYSEAVYDLSAYNLIATGDTTW